MPNLVTVYFPFAFKYKENATVRSASILAQSFLDVGALQTSFPPQPPSIQEQYPEPPPIEFDIPPPPLPDVELPDTP